MTNDEFSFTMPSSASSKGSDLRSLIQLYYYNNYGGQVRCVTPEELVLHEQEFVKTFLEFRVPADNEKVLLAFKPHDTSHPIFPQSSVFCTFESAEKLRRFCAEKALKIVVNKSPAHPVWLTYREVLLADPHDLSYGSEARLVLEIGRDGVFHIPSKKVARAVRNTVSRGVEIAVRNTHVFES